MSLNKKIFWMCLFLISTPLATFAIYQQPLPPMAPVTQQHGFSIGIYMGQTFQEWERVSSQPSPGSTVPWPHGTFYLTINTQYQFNNNIAIEGGLMDMTSTTLPIGNVNTLTTYVAAKIISSLFDLSGMHSIFKVGAAYVNNTMYNEKTHYFSPLFGSGIQLDLTDNTSLNLEYLFLLGYQGHFDSSHQFKTPSISIVDVGINYQFSS